MPQPTVLQSHLWTAFLNGFTTDISLRIIAQGWTVVYDLHRVVLIQSGFFRSLFTRGFRESPSPVGVQRDVIDIHFDDPNITRAAFEICISRLYGGGPQLYVPPSLIPTIAQPLTPNFLSPLTYSPPPAHHHPATPRFLLSLIATSMYLSIPSISSQALSLVLTTVGPSTVIRYLNFALGNGIGEAGPGDLARVAELEGVGREVESLPEEKRYLPSISTTHEEEEAEDSDVPSTGSHKHGCEGSSSDLPNAAKRTTPCDEQDDHLSPLGGHHQFKPLFNYGLVGSKVGEACASWLARWATDILPYEEEYYTTSLLSVSETKAHGRSTPSGSRSVPQSPISSQPLGYDRPLSHPPRSALNSRFVTSPPRPARRATVSTEASGAQTRRFATQTSSSRPPPIWSSHSGLCARWVRGLISSNDMFITGGERERYDFATRVVEMRRRELLAGPSHDGAGALDLEEEKEWEELFNSGLYYSHMSLEDLLYVQHDISPSTQRPYVTLTTLQNALWNQSVLRSHIMSHPSVVGSPTSSSPHPLLNQQSAALASPRLFDAQAVAATASGSGSHDAQAAKRSFFPIPTDGSHSLGGDIPKDAVDALVDEAVSDTNSNASTRRAAARRLPIDEANFFGLSLNGKKTADDIAKEIRAAGGSPDRENTPSSWTETEPCRFSVEYWGVESLKPSNRLYSHTVWCMGSLWNVYVQLVRKKGTGPGTLQLGVYLQRQSFVDAIPPHSVPKTQVTKSLSHFPSVPSLQPAMPTPVAAPSALSPTRSRPWAVPAFSSSMTVLPTRSMTPAATGSPPNHGGSHLGLVAGSPPPSTILPPGSPSTSQTLPLTAPSSAPHSPYRDPRQSIQAYFSISCPSATGVSSTKFSSGPDSFNVTQSWGWKSSKAEEWVDVKALDSDLREGKDSDGRTEWCSLRATIVLGVL